ncbi:hypothetical protein BDF19DRAFT_412966 [Syncephalis fuscata]|nr:hypothetical protein BDF19DRAFT_412966 [Syncephalis fuscata]
MPTHQNWSTNNSIFRQMEQICNSNTNYMERILQVEDDTIGVNYRQEDAMEDTRRGPNPSTSFSARLDPNQQRQSRMEGNAPADYGHPHSHNNSDSQDNEEEIHDKRSVHGTSTGKQTGNDVLLLVTAFTEMCRTIRFLRQSMPHQSLEPPPHFYYTENEAARHVNRHSNNEMTSPRDESTANQHQNHSSWNGNEQRIDPILNRRAIHCDTATVEEADVTIPRSQQGSDTSSTYKRSSNSEVKTALKAYDNTQNTSTPHNYYKQQQDEEEIDLFKANKEQDPPVVSWNADRQNVQPIVNRATSATYSITSPKDRSSLSLFTSYPEQPTDQENNENRYETKNDNEMSSN